MNRHTRREFLGDVGRGMVIAGLGSSLASDLGFSAAFATEPSNSLSFGEYAPLVALMQETPSDKLQQILIARLQSGDVKLEQLTAAAALANAESFGGQDYVGFHTAMAFLPALQMSKRLSPERRALPVLKVLYRNADQIQNTGGASKKTLKRNVAPQAATGATGSRDLRDASRQGDLEKSEQIFSSVSNTSPKDMLNFLQLVVQDDINVHRFVMAHRAYGLIDLVGKQHAHTVLRQCVGLCVTHERGRLKRDQPESPIRALMPKLIDTYHLQGRKLGKRQPDDAWIAKTSEFLYKANKEQAAETVAGALADGFHPEAVGEAISLAANQLVLRQGPGRWRTHGDSQGVHSTDAMNAWRNMARVTDESLAITGLIVGAYHTASYGNFKSEPYPTETHRSVIKKSDAPSLLAETEDAIRNNDQGRATAAIQIYGEKEYALRPVLDLMLKYAVSEDGRLHGEKFFHTVTEEYATTRPAFRWRQIVGLARVTASAYAYDRNDKRGSRAPGYEDACRQLKIEV